MVGIEQPQLSRILSGERGASNQVMANIAVALGIPQETVFQKAGILAEKPEHEQHLDEALHLLSMLKEDDLNEILEIARMKLERKSSKSSSRGKPPARTVIGHIEQ